MYQEISQNRIPGEEASNLSSWTAATSAGSGLHLVVKHGNNDLKIVSTDYLPVTLTVYVGFVFMH